jgi:hypothetical protein
MYKGRIVRRFNGALCIQREDGVFFFMWDYVGDIGMKVSFNISRYKPEYASDIKVIDQEIEEL